MYAVDDLSDAIDVTRNFLTPVTAGKWLRLVLVVFFIGGAGGTSFSTPPGGFDGGTGTGTGADTPPIEEILPIIVGLAIVFGVIGLVWLAISSLMQFVFVNSLGEEEVHVRRYGKANLRNAAHLLLFQVALFLAAFALVGVPALAIYFLVGVEGIGLALFLLLGLFGIGVFVVSSVVTSLTINFVVPIMLMESVGILDGWRRFWPTLRREWKEYAVYYVLAWILRIVVGIGVGFVVLVVAAIVGIPLLILVIVLFFIPIVGWLLAALLVLVGVLLFALLTTVVQVPVESYFRYYALLVLGDTEERFDLIPDQRARVRADGGETDEPEDEWADTGWDTDEDEPGTDESERDDSDDERTF